MVQFQPIEASLVDGPVAARVAIPPYDSLTPQQRSELAGAEPLSFLHALPSGDDDAGRVEAVAGLERLVSHGVFGPEQAGFFVYRFGDRTASQTGLVGGVAIDDVIDGVVLPHEQVRPDRVTGLVDYQEAVGASSSPVAMTYRATSRLDNLVARITARAPDLHFAAGDGVAQTVWRVEEEASEVAAAAREVTHAYITDGHHRVAAAVEIAHRRRLAGQAPGRAGQLLSVLFPDHDLRLHGFHRLVVPFDPIDGLLRDLGPQDLVAVPIEDLRPQDPGWCGLLVGGRSFRFRLPGSGDVLPDRLDPNRLQDHVLGPLLGVVDPGRDPRLDNVPGTVPVDELVARASGGVGFVLHPVTMADFMLVSEMGASMPPKSTYFSP
ncbi:MAG: DUF1015 family protein, partial [Acidimicrobiia bacterium]|nr:DUF1015 family protein [Acidimicrobiia bacterium]